MELRCAALWFAATLILPSLGFAQSGVATVAADATIYEEQANDNAGGDAHYCIGNHDTNETRRAFVRLDLPAIPPGSIITRIEYNFTQNRVRQQCVSCTATLVMRRVTESWQEGSGSGPGMGPCGGGAAVAGVNWNNQPAVGEVSAMEFLPDTDDTPTPITIDTDIGDDDDGLIADVQGWVDGDFGNFGWRFQVAEEDTADNARRMQPGSMTIHWTAPPWISKTASKILPDLSIRRHLQFRCYTGAFPNPNTSPRIGELRCSWQSSLADRPQSHSRSYGSRGIGRNAKPDAAQNLIGQTVTKPNEPIGLQHPDLTYQLSCSCPPW